MKVVACLHGHRALGAFFILSLMCLLVPASAPGETKVAGERALAIISGKGPDVLVLKVHGFKHFDANRLAVGYNPMIYDVDGSSLTLKDLKIPCQAYVEYKWAKGALPQLFRLEVQSYDDKANSLFTEKKKTKRLPE